jgi:5-methylthioadenosine/S-adenosylhomocysteine deaminase
VASLLIRNGLLVTMNDRLDVFAGCVAVRDATIAAVGPEEQVAAERFDRVVDARGGFVLPGFVQTHVHLCQTLFRGFADDLPLLEWLRLRIWPLEAAHRPESLRAAARVAAAELLLSGTTCALTMETVHDTDAVFEAIDEIGLRATIGKCMMDSDDEAPQRLRESTAASLDESVAIHRRWHGAANGRLRVAFAPRFAVSCSRGLLESVASLSADAGALVHTHAAEAREEIEVVRRIAGTTNLRYLDDTGLGSPRLCVAHCVWVDEGEQQLIADRGIKVLHCPGSNLKLGSGIAPVPELRARGVSVSIGADGAACNNHLDMFGEMRLAATLQAMRLGPGSLPARDVVWMATRGGAEALGLAADIGSLEPGKRADMIVVDRSRPHMAAGGDPYSSLVYAARAADVRTTVVDGALLVDDFTLQRLDAREVAAEARRQARQLADRAGI